MLNQNDSDGLEETSGDEELKELGDEELGETEKPKDSEKDSNTEDESEDENSETGRDF